MTFSEFRRRTNLIRCQRLDAQRRNVLENAIEKKLFEQAKLEEMIDLARRTNSLNAGRKAKAWQRILAKVETTRADLERTTSSQSTNCAAAS